MKPIGRASSVAQEALSLLEAYLDIDDDGSHTSALRPKSATQARKSCAAVQHEPANIDHKLKKFSLREPLPQSVGTPSRSRCGLCGQTVPDGLKPPDPTKQNTTCSFHISESPVSGSTFEHTSSKPDDKGDSVPRYPMQLISTSSEVSGPSSPQEVPISPSHFVPLCCPSVVGDDEASDGDKFDVVERQHSAFSISSSVEPQSSLTSDVTSRTPSRVRSGGLLASFLPTDAHVSVLRSRSMGSEAARSKSFVPPNSMLQPSVPKSTTFGRCVSVPSAPNQMLRQPGSKPKRWGRFSIFRHRKHQKGIEKVKSFGSLPFGAKITSQEALREGDEPFPTRLRTPRPSRGQAALSALSHLLPRRFRYDHDEQSTPYLSGGISLLFGEHTLSQFRRKNRFWKRGERPERETSDVAASSIVPPPGVSNVSLEITNEQVTQPQFVADAFSKATFQTGQRSPSDIHSTAAWHSNSRLLATHEMTHIYKELIQTAEGDRLNASAAEAWRNVHRISMSERPRTLFIDGTHETDPHRIARPHKPDLIRGHRVLRHSEENRTAAHIGLARVSEVDHLTSSDQRNSDTSTDSPSCLSDHIVPLPPSRNNSSSVAAVPPLVADHPDAEPVPYTIVANMINALSQRIMNNISEEELERRLHMWEQKAATVPNHKPSNPPCAPGFPHQPVGLSSSTELLAHRNSGVDGNHTRSGKLRRINSARFPTEKRLLKHSMLAQARRLEQRKKIDVCVDLLNRLVAHTNYPAFEADMLELLGRQPSWHQISILYYLARCAVRHLLNSHFSKLDSLSKSTEPVNQLNTFRHSYSFTANGELSTCVTVLHDERSVLQSPVPTTPAALAEIGRCRASVERVKDFTITFFFRWYADWVNARGGWQSVIEETDDSELD
ncbi:hypothetical protein CRM22_004802 [Opisthorchis felineus]|uniref:Uncharacterized protein n=1 Tax=Opisthorchis felineus TaxID=147828 RepID=A0A4S2LUC0_OPIFE|nr:hypothetical protein CRM22_004802 [Opisthorchis felineus]